MPPVAVSANTHDIFCPLGIVMEGKCHDITEAVQMMLEAKIPVAKRGSFFLVEHPDWGGEFITCDVPYRVGFIEISVRADELPPVVYFQRFDFREAATFVIAAYNQAGLNAPAAKIVAAMRDLDAAYDRDIFRKRVQEWEQEFEVWRKSQ